MTVKLADTPWPCPVCSSVTFAVTDARATKSSIRRRRVCSECGHRITTHEFLATDEPKAKINAENNEQIMKHLRIASGHLISISDLLTGRHG